MPSEESINPLAFEISDLHLRALIYLQEIYLQRQDCDMEKAAGNGCK